MIRGWLSFLPPEQIERENELREIFFLSSNRHEFLTEEEKQNFWHRWTDYYFTKCPDLIFVYMVNEKIAGYILGSADSTKAQTELTKDLPSFTLFSDMFPKYPGHLHINLHPDYRGQGMGGLLIKSLCRELHRRGCPGVHLVTAPEARNVSFYRQQGFTHEQTRDWKDSPLLFIAREL